MRSAISINLASQPFRRDRPLLAASIAGSTILIALVCYQVFTIWIRHNEAEEARAAVQRTDAQVRLLAVEQSRLETVLREPANAEALDYSIFLNGILLRKGISWTGIFSDLEDVLPHNVRLIGIRPQLNVDNQVLLDMTVASESVEPVIEMLRKLESSPQFGKIESTTWLPPSQSEPLYRYRVSANYAPTD
jgi:type IV pilus assembly protein PilN